MAASSKRSNAVAVTAGIDHTCALTHAGGVKCWGYNGHDEIGGGGPGDNVWTPVDVQGLSSGVTAVSAGLRHSCAVTSAGGVKCWGANYSGALGDGTADRRFGPVDVVGLSSGVTAVAGGYDSTCALLSSGGVKCWGYNAQGKLGDGTQVDRLTPVDVVGLSSGVAAISTGSLVSCALTSVGAVKCWGFHYGFTPADVPGLSTGVTALATGFPLCALTTAGAVKCWGGDSGWTPLQIPGLASSVIAIANGGGHTCALTSGGAVKCWGQNDHGQLGDGTTIDRSTPVDVAGLSGGVTAIAAGGSYTCASTRTGGVKCWGWNSVGNLGDGTKVERHRPVSVVGFGPAPCVVPGVVGKRFAKARAAIARAKCRVGVVAHVHSKRPRNIVLRQSPRAGTQSNAGSRVRLIVSRG